MDKEWALSVKKRLGKNIKRLRTMHGLSIYDISKTTGISWHTIQKWEYGYNAPGLDMLIWMCRRMGWRLGDVLHGCNVSEEALSDARTK